MELIGDVLVKKQPQLVIWIYEPCSAKTFKLGCRLPLLTPVFQTRLRGRFFSGKHFDPYGILAYMVRHPKPRHARKRKAICLPAINWIMTVCDGSTSMSAVHRIG
ncbi:MAG: hypothetical protein ACM3VW_04680 [Bacteroidota bacterium]